MEGHSSIAPAVLASYAADATPEVPGAHPKQRRGARVAGTAIEVHLVVDYGAEIPRVAAEVQRHVREYLQRMADLTPSAVHVVVDDVQRG
jgi:hypothetical protein